jgi:hypothetical protein
VLTSPGTRCQIVRYVCEHNPTYATAELFKEFLTGARIPTRANLCTRV